MAELLAAPEFVFDICAGSVGGFCSKALDYPLDSAKVILQTQKQDAKIKFTGTYDCIKQSVQQKGFASLYNGISSRLLGSMAENAVCFLAYAGIKRELTPLITATADKSSEKFRQQYLAICSVSGAGSGAVVSFVMTPVELVKCRMQVSAQLATPVYKGSVDCFVKTFQQGGLQGLYKGHMSTMYREVPGNLFWYLTYELACDALAPLVGTSREELPIRAQMGAGALAGVSYWAAIYPADTVKSILQTQSPATTTGGGELTLPTTFRQAFSKMYQEQGLRGLYRGFGVTALRAAPANAVLFAAYEQTQQFLKRL